MRNRDHSDHKEKYVEHSNDQPTCINLLAWTCLFMIAIFLFVLEKARRNIT